VSAARDSLLATTDPSWQLADRELWLRAWRSADLPQLVAACQDPAIARWTRVPTPYSETDASAFLLAQGAELAAGRELHLAVVRAGEDELLGSIGLAALDWGNLTAEIGYWAAAPARGHGITRRAVSLLSAWAFDALGLARLEILVSPDNRSSRRVAEAAGFTREGRLRSYRDLKGKRRDYDIFSLLPGDPAPTSDARPASTAG